MLRQTLTADSSPAFKTRRTGVIGSQNSQYSPSRSTETAPSEVSPDQGFITGEATGFLTPYFKDLSCVEVMSRDEELAAAVQIANLRQTYWKSILSYPPFIDGICDLAR